MTPGAWRDPSTDSAAPGRFISTESVVLAVYIQLQTLPGRGSSTRASSATSRPGGGFTTLAVAAAQGANTNLAAPLGTGPNSFAVRRRLADIGVSPLTDVFVGDIGVALVMIEHDGNATTVRTSGVEAEPTRAGLEAIELRPGDVVHISGDDLASNAWEVLTEWGSQLPSYVRLVLAAAPSVDEVPYEAWLPLLQRADVMTMNIREAAALTDTLRRNGGGRGWNIRDFIRSDAAIIRRLGDKGCEIQSTAQSRTINLPPFRTRRVDNTGVGDAHVATMCAGLLDGLSLIEACRRGNAAAALIVSQGPTLIPPAPAQIDEVLHRGIIS